jgi:hypothetical protein
MSIQEKISKLLVTIIRAIHRIDSKYYKNIYNPNPKKFDDLTPHYEKEDGNTYSETLLWAIRNPAVKNLALTGPYGSGKSSILKTFEEDHREFTYLNISLASFEDDIQSDLDVRKRIEISILQQMFYKVSVRKVPFSRFRRIRNTPAWHFILSAGWMMIWVIAGVFIFKPQFFNRLSWWAGFVKRHGDFTLYTAILLFVTGTILFLSRLFQTYNSTQFKKLNVSNGEVELAQETDTSILNKHLDEILYFFEETSYNLIIIEDLDRFQDPEIFSKLRELNNLINSSSQVHRKVTFLYALKDDVFKDNNRTKFFDFLIPVIPVINSSNSGEKLLKKFEDAKNKGLLSDTFISDITLFIEDMRMLKNIYNEYILYKEKIGLKVNEEKLLGIIVYKNFYPSDFAALNINQGLVFQSFIYKQQAISDIQRKDEQQIAGFNERINFLENEQVLNIRELRSVYALAIVDKLANAYRYRVGSTMFENNELLGDTFFEALQGSNTIQYIQSGYGSWQNAGFTFKSVEKEINPQQTYEQRKATINARISGEVTQLQTKINKLKEQNTQIEGWSLQQLIDKRSISTLYPEAANEKLLTYLLRRGYIDEMYHTYISFFYEGTITRTDMDFVVAVKNFTPFKFDFDLFKIGQIIKKFNINEYQQSELLNYHLLDYLAQNNLKHKSEFYALIAQLRNKKAISDEFLDGYLSKGKITGVVLKALTNTWAGIWDHQLTIKSYTPERLDAFLKAILLYAELPDLTQIDNNGALNSYIANKPDFLELFEPKDFAKIKKVITQLNIEFKDLEYRKETAEVFEFVYKNSHYEISAGMIEKIIGIYGSPDEKLAENLNNKNYSTISKSGCTPLLNYVNENLSLYVNEVMLTLPDNASEEADLLIPMLNSDLELDLKKAVLKQGTDVFSNIAELPNDLWTYAFQEDSVMPDWQNVIVYFQSEEKDEIVLTAWLNFLDNAEHLSDDKMGETGGEDETSLSSLCQFILLNNNLTDKVYEKLLGNLLWSYNTFAAEKLSKSKIEILLKKRTINFTKSNYDLLKANYNGLNINLLAQNYSKYLAKPDDYVFDSSDYIYLFYSALITPTQKVELIKSMDAEIIKNKTLSDLISDKLIAKPDKVTLEVLIKLLTYNSIQSSKIKLINMNFSSLTDEQRRDSLNLAESPYDQINIKGKRPSIIENDDNLDLVKRLSVYEMIASYKRAKGKIMISNKRK